MSAVLSARKVRVPPGGMFGLLHIEIVALLSFLPFGQLLSKGYPESDTASQQSSSRFDSANISLICNGRTALF